MSWSWKQTLDSADSDDAAWAVYSDPDAAKIEAAFQSGQDTVELNDTYTVNLKELVQHRYILILESAIHSYNLLLPLEMMIQTADVQLDEMNQRKEEGTIEYWSFFCNNIETNCCHIL